MMPRSVRSALRPVLTAGLLLVGCGNGLTDDPGGFRREPPTSPALQLAFAAPRLLRQPGLLTIYHAAAVERFDSDQQGDLAVTDWEDNSLVLWPGMGDGTFGAVRALCPGQSLPGADGLAVFPKGVASDGQPDLAVAFSGREANKSGDVMLVDIDWQNKSKVSCRALGVAGLAIGLPTYVTAAKLRSGAPWEDLVINHQRGAQVLRSRGDGQFEQLPVLDAGGSGGAPVVLDLNKDGELDILVAAGRDLHTFFGDGSGAFTAGPVTTVPVSLGSGRIVTGQLNRTEDDHWDLAVPVSDGLRIFLGGGDGTFRTGAPVSLHDVQSVVSEDFNQDQVPDLAISHFLSKDVHVVLGDGRGAFTGGGVFPGTCDTASIIGADLNNDGRQDLVVVGRTAVVDPNDRTKALALCREVAVLMNESFAP